MDTLETIELCQNLFYLFAGIAAVSFLLCVYLFFKFDIPYIYSMLTGKTRKRTIEQMEKQKFQTGRLRIMDPHTGNSKHHTKKQGKTGGVGTGGLIAQSGPARSSEPELAITAPMRSSVEITAPLADNAHPDTQVLHTEVPQTQELREEEYTAVISASVQEDESTEVLGKTAPLKQEPQFLFQVTEDTLCVNTLEII